MIRAPLLIEFVRERCRQHSRQRYRRGDCVRLLCRDGKHRLATVLYGRYVISRFHYPRVKDWGWCYALRFDDGEGSMGLIEERRLRPGPGPVKGARRGR